MTWLVITVSDHESHPLSKGSGDPRDHYTKMRCEHGNSLQRRSSGTAPVHGKNSIASDEAHRLQFQGGAENRNSQRSAQPDHELQSASTAAGLYAERRDPLKLSGAGEPEHEQS